jgi:hypothetical protein
VSAQDAGESPCAAAKTLAREIVFASEHGEMMRESGCDPSEIERSARCFVCNARGLVVASVLFLLTAVAASLAPAFRAASIDPATTLRND